MKVIYNCEEKILDIGMKKKIKLSRLENRLLICLSSENTMDIRKISVFLYGISDRYSVLSARHVVYRLRRKSIEIKTLKGIGYRLVSKIFYK